MRILITGRFFGDNLATLNALNEVPHPGVEIVVTDLGTEAAAQEGDGWYWV